jgi:hypothetical protein
MEPQEQAVAAVAAEQELQVASSAAKADRV